MGKELPDRAVRIGGLAYQITRENHGELSRTAHRNINAAGGFDSGSENRSLGDSD